jgi:hypothetical protein
MRFLQVKNWRSFQHYGKRNPPWIKLHRALLDDYAFCALLILPLHNRTPVSA